MAKYNVCINSSNLHVGGGVQVATSFISELSKLEVDCFELTVFASSEVHGNLKQISANISAFKEYEVFDCYGLYSMFPKNTKKFKRFDVVFTIFGPDYSIYPNNTRITGFAQPWIIFPQNEIFQKLSKHEMIMTRIKFFLQSLFFKRSSKIVVELEHVKQGVIDRKIARSENVFVVPNCLSSIYYEPDKWDNISLPVDPKKFSIGYVGRDYTHKNTNIIPKIKDILLNQYSLDVDFYVTLNPEEWKKKSSEFHDSIYNIGALNVAQCPRFYQNMDAIIFPSILECFSATPLEAMFMEKPLFASDRGFVRDVCGDFAFYFDPVRPDTAAAKISHYITSYSGKDQDRLKAAREHVVKFSSARQRALSYLNIIKSCLTCREQKDPLHDNI